MKKKKALRWIDNTLNAPDTYLTRDLLAMAHTDGNFSQKEYETFLSICERAGISHVELMDSLRGNPPTAGLKIPRTDEEKEKYIGYLKEMMDADGERTPDELYVLERIAEKIGYSLKESPKDK